MYTNLSKHESETTCFAHKRDAINYNWQISLRIWRWSYNNWPVGAKNVLTEISLTLSYCASHLTSTGRWTLHLCVQVVRDVTRRCRLRATLPAGKEVSMYRRTGLWKKSIGWRRNSSGQHEVLKLQTTIDILFRTLTKVWDATASPTLVNTT